MSKHEPAGMARDPNRRAPRVRRRTALMLSTALVVLVMPRPALAQDANALPTGGVVVGGSATIGAPTLDARLQVHQSSDRALIEWNSFDIGSAAEVSFLQPGANAVALNRVVGGTAPSQIAGKLNANGIVAVINSNGVMFAGTADVNVGGLIASTADVNNAEFLAGGAMRFSGPADATGEIVVNAGASISIADQGLALFFAPAVRNHGLIQARLGRVALASGSSATLDLDGTGFLEIGLGGNSALVENGGTIANAGGRILMTARTAGAVVDQVINTGFLSAAGASVDPDGSILLSAATGDVHIGGTIDVGPGGRAEVLAGKAVTVVSAIAATGDLSLKGRHILGAGDIDVTGTLGLALDVQGADTTGEGDLIGDALGVIGTVTGGSRLDLGAGRYAAGAIIDRDNVTIDGGGVATIVVPVGATISGLTVSGGGATIRGLSFAGDLPDGTAAWNVAWGGTTTQGIALLGGVDGATITGNSFTGLHSGILVDGRGVASLTITGNVIDNSKSGIALQYVDGSAPGFDISGNSAGAPGNEWGIILHQSANGLLGANPSLDVQAHLLALSQANGGMAVYDQGYTASNRTHVTVSPTGSSSGQGAFTTPLGSVNAGINAVVTGGTVSVRPGAYMEGVTGVSHLGGPGNQKFGLFIPKNGITLRGVDANDRAITSADDVVAFITAANQAGFGAQHFISGSDVTIEGLGFKPAAAGDNKTVEVIGDNFTLRNSVIDNRGNITAANFYISDFELAGTPRVERFTLEDNIFYGGTTASAMVTVAGGVGRETDAANRIVSGNRIIGNGLADQRGFQIQGRIPTTAWQQLTAGVVTVTNNLFDNVDVPVRTVGQLVGTFAWDDVFRSNGNVFADGAAMAYAGDTLAARAAFTANGDADIRITSRIASSVKVAQSGDVVRMLNGTYDLGGSPLVIDKSIALIGESRDGVILDGRAVGSGSGSNGLGTISVFADNVTLGNFTLYGSQLALGNYGIKVQPNPAGHMNTPGGDDQRLLNFAISDVTIRGSRRAELDLNGVVGATITNVTADGRSLTDPSQFTAGAGIQISDSANVTLAGVHTLGNDWGGVALYQSNKASGYDGQTTNINIDAAQNRFDEALGLFSQLESITQGFGQLNLTGFDYAVRNTDHRTDDLDAQFIYYRTSLDDARAFALSVGAAGASSIEGFANGLTNVFTVVDGLSIGAALRDARSGATVQVGAGRYAETLSINKGLTLTGAGIDATAITGGIQLSGTFSDLTLRDFTVSGSAGTAVIGGGQVTNLTVDGVRIDGEDVAGRHGIAGGRYGGALSITNSEFLNIRGWAAFDTRSGAGSATDGTQITSAIFSGNLLDNTIGHIAFRQQAGSGAYPVVTIANNVVRNGGNSDQSFGAVFKAFRAAQVDFTGNIVSDVGTGGAAPAGEAAYGAVLMTRDVGTLNVTGNSFTNNNQVFAVEPGYALPGVTNFTDNSFVNNRYAIYLPANVSGAGTIRFGGTNDFVAGADTIQHIVWRSAAALDLTSVSFDGTLVGNLDLDALFTVEDLITHGVDMAGAGLARLVAGQLYVTPGAGTDSALRAVALAAEGDRLNLSAGTHRLGGTLFLQKQLDVAGQGQGVTILDASGHAGYGIRVHADDVSLSGFTLNGSPATGSNANYGIKVEAGSGSLRNDGFAISHVTIDGSRKTGLDLNTVTGALIDGVTVTGVIAGNGISITDSADVTVRNSSTSGNAWGGLALYQSNSFDRGGSDQQLTGITIEASNRFGEANGLYLQDSSTLHDPGLLTILGYGYTVRNAAHRQDGAQFTYFQQSLQDALDYGVNLATPGASIVQGWSGSANGADFHVGHGTLTGGGSAALSLQTAFDGSGEGAVIHVASGRYAESATLTGTRQLRFGDVTLDGLALSGAGIGLVGNLTLATGDFIATAPLLLNGDTSIRALAGGIDMAGASGDVALILSGTTVGLGRSTLGALGITADNIVLSGVTTSGEQSYSGAATLAGNYAARRFTVTGDTTLADDTLIEAGGAVTLGTVRGVHGLAIRGASIGLGGASLVSLDATAATITAGSVTTTGAQHYAGAMTLTGDFSASDFSVLGDTMLAGATQIEADGAVALGTVRGAHGLAIRSASITLAGGSLASLDATAETIVAGGVTTTGVQRYTGATTVAGDYRADSFTVAGDTTLAGTTLIDANGVVTLDTVQGVHDLTVRGAAVALGGASLASLDVTGETITAGGITTTGVQRYSGATTLAGDFSAGSFTVLGDTTLAGASVIAADGAVALGAVQGAYGLVVRGTTVTLTQASLASLDVTGETIATSDVSTTGAQRYAGFTSLAGRYAASDFTAENGVRLTGDTTVAATGALRLGAVGATASGLEGESLTLGGRTVALGDTNVGALDVTADETVLNGAAYSAGSLAFAGSTVRLTRGETRFETRGTSGDVSIRAHLVGTGNGAQNVVFDTGAGDVALDNVGSDAMRLGDLTVIGDDFSAATVKLAGNFVSQLTGNQIFSANTLDTLGNVSATVAGSESGPIRAGGAVAVSAGTSGSGSIIAGGPVQLSYSGDVDRAVTSQGEVSLVASGAVGGTIKAVGTVAVKAAGPVRSTVETTGAATIASQSGVSGTIQAAGPVEVNAAGPVSAAVTTGGSASITSAAGISSNVTAGGGVTVTASHGDVSGSINATGPVNVNADGAISSTIIAAGDASVKSASGSISSAINAGGSVAVTAPGAVTSTISSGGAISLTSDTPIDVQVTGGAVMVNAPGGKVGGVFNEITTGDGGSFVVNDQPVVGSGKINARQIIVDRFIRPAGGTIGASGEIRLPAGRALGLIAPGSTNAAGRPPVLVNSVDGLGDLLRRGYTAIVIDIDQSGLAIERPLAERAAN